MHNHNNYKFSKTILLEADRKILPIINVLDIVKVVALDLSANSWAPN